MSDYFKRKEHMHAWSEAVKKIEEKAFTADNLFINYYTNKIYYYKDKEAALIARNMFIFKIFYTDCFSAMNSTSLIKTENIK